jgi:phytoene dehydrogenase-like protein
MSDRLSIGIVGGGIAGLYCAWKLATKGHSITLFECLDHFGGRIETRPLGDFKAECGPMRFELALQPLFKKLAKDELGAEFDKFSEPTGGTDRGNRRVSPLSVGRYGKVNSPAHSRTARSRNTPGRSAPAAVPPYVVVRSA